MVILQVNLVCYLHFCIVLHRMEWCLVWVVQVLSLSFLVLCISNDLTLLKQSWLISYNVEDRVVPSTIQMMFFISLLYSLRSTITSLILLLYSLIRGIILFFKNSSVSFSFGFVWEAGDVPSILWIA